MNKSALPRTFALFTAITLLAVMLAISPISSFGPAAAYPSESVSYLEKILQADVGSGKQENNRNRLSSDGVMVTNVVDQELFQGGTNVYRDNDVVVGRCDDGQIQVNDDDEVTQTNLQSTNQEANIDNEEEADSDNEEEADSDNEEEADSE